MILRRYGNSVHSVRANFDSRSMTEIGFQRDHDFSMPVDEFETTYGRTAGHELRAEGEGPVQGVAEETLLESLDEQLRGLDGGLAEGEVLLIENEQGKDMPKTRGVQRSTVVGNENRLHFQYSVDPPLRVGIYRRNG